MADGGLVTDIDPADRYRLSRSGVLSNVRRGTPQYRKSVLRLASLDGEL